MTNIKATLYDGSYHDVDSSEMAFKMAASLAFKKGIEEAKPVLLEPVMKLSIYVPEEYMGDIMGDITKCRGKVLGMEPVEDQPGMQQIIAEVPMSELSNFPTTLRSVTRGKGSFNVEYARYEEVPEIEVSKVIESIKTAENQ